MALRDSPIVLLVALGASLAAHVGAAVVVVRGHASATRDPAPVFAGETLAAPDAPDEVTQACPPQNEIPIEAPLEAREPSTPPTPDAIGAPHVAAHARPASAATRSGETSSAGEDGHGLYGAVGDRSALDLGIAFRQAFRQVASSDRAWEAAPFGAAGELDVRVEIDDDGHISDEHLGAGSGAALRSSVSRTLAFIRVRPFVSRAKVTTLHLIARVSPDDAHDGLHGDKFALGYEIGSPENVFFALPIGRRIDVRIVTHSK